MSTEPETMIVTALIRPNMEGRVVEALHELGEFPGFFITEVRGQGRGRGAGGSYEATDFELTYHRFLQIQMACRPSAAERVCDVIAKAAWTGRKGDGVIFTTPAGSFCRIREAGSPKVAP
jgi:nitrogen regulatory protein PII